MSETAAEVGLVKRCEDNIEHFDNRMTERVAMKVALLGATGFVGSALRRLLILEKGPTHNSAIRQPYR